MTPSFAPLAFLTLFAAMVLALPLAAPSPRFPRREQVSLALVLLSVALAASGGLISAKALPLAGGAIALALGVRCLPAHPVWQTGLRIVLALWAIVAAFHAWPGFSPLAWMPAFGRLGQALLWHYDKGLAGYLLLLALPRPLPAPRSGYRWLAALPLGAAGLAVLGWGIGLAQPDPRYLPGLPIWLAGNLFLTVVAEEALFRGLLQGPLTRLLSGRLRHAYPLALALTATLFAAAHFKWGLSFAALALLAGLFYGALAGPRLRLERAILAHFATNAALLILMRSPLG